MTEPEPSSAPASSWLERLLGVITEVKPGEGVTALILTFNVFILLVAYYLIKPVREALILALESGAEYKSYMGGVIAVALLFAVPAYAKIADRLPRNRLVVGVTLFFAVNLVFFYAGSFVEVIRTNLGLVFYLWVGIFNMMVVAQFWAFANDVYTEEQGKRLFALVGVGASTGAAVGSGLGLLLSTTLGIYQMLVVSAGLLLCFAALIQVVHSRETRRQHRAAEAVVGAPAAGEAEEAPIAPKGGDRKGAFGLVLRVRYLLMLALFSLIFTLVNTNGEYMLGKLIKEAAEAAVAAGTIAEDEMGDLIGARFSEFYLYVNIFGVLLQTFVVSRLVKYGGLKLSFFVLPVIALLNATGVSILPVLAVLWVGKIAENSTDYSVNNTVRNMLWLPTTREMKYKAKQAVDTFFIRMGDVGSAILVAILAGWLGFGVRAFALANVIVVVVWLFLAAAIIREYRRMAVRTAAEAGDGPAD